MIRIKIETGNAAFVDDNNELSRILLQLSESLHSWHPSEEPFEWRISDANGNKVGTIRHTKGR